MTKRPQATLTAPARIAAALAVAGIVFGTCAAAAHESRWAVQESSAAMAIGTIHVTLAPVEIVARRDTAHAGAQAL